MSQQLSDFDTEHGLALLQNSTMQLLLAQHPNELAFISDALQLSDEEARARRPPEDRQGQPRPDAVDQRHPRPRPRRAAGRRRPSTGASPPTRAPTRPLREAKLAEHGGDAWAAIHDLARLGSQPPASPPAAEPIGMTRSEPLKRTGPAIGSGVRSPRSRPGRCAGDDRTRRRAAGHAAWRRCWRCAGCAAAPATSTLSYLRRALRRRPTPAGTCWSATPAARPAGSPPAPASSRRARWSRSPTASRAACRSPAASTRSTRPRARPSHELRVIAAGPRLARRRRHDGLGSAARHGPQRRRARPDRRGLRDAAARRRPARAAPPRHTSPGCSRPPAPAPAAPSASWPPCGTTRRAAS